MKKLTQKQQKIVSQLLTMHEMFPENESELIYHTPFQLLVAVMMSAQATDRQVNKITQVLWNFATSPQDIMAIGEDKLRDMIKSINYYNTKAKHIYQTAKILSDLEWMQNYLIQYPDQQSLYDQQWYVISQDISQLTTLPWVGVKTAKVVLHVLFWQDRVAADTHVHRVANRLDWVHTSTPLKTSDKLEVLIPTEYKTIAHHSIILFGRYHCTARNPKCQTCPLQQQCPWYRANKE